MTTNKHLSYGTNFRKTSIETSSKGTARGALTTLGESSDTAFAQHTRCSRADSHATNVRVEQNCSDHADQFNQHEQRL